MRLLQTVLWSLFCSWENCLGVACLRPHRSCVMTLGITVCLAPKPPHHTVCLWDGTAGRSNTAILLNENTEKFPWNRQVESCFRAALWAKRRASLGNLNSFSEQKKLIPTSKVYNHHKVHTSESFLLSNITVCAEGHSPVWNVTRQRGCTIILQASVDYFIKNLTLCKHFPLYIVMLLHCVEQCSEAFKSNWVLINIYNNPTEWFGVECCHLYFLSCEDWYLEKSRSPNWT